MADVFQFPQAFPQAHHFPDIGREQRRFPHALVEGAGFVHLLRQFGQGFPVGGGLIVVRQGTHPLVQGNAGLEQQLHLLAEQADLRWRHPGALLLAFHGVLTSFFFQ